VSRWQPLHRRCLALPCPHFGLELVIVNDHDQFLEGHGQQQRGLEAVGILDFCDPKQPIGLTHADGNIPDAKDVGIATNARASAGRSSHLDRAEALLRN